MLTTSRKTNILRKLAVLRPGTYKGRWRQTGKDKKISSVAIKNQAIKGKVRTKGFTPAVPSIAKNRTYTPGVPVDPTELK